MKRKLFDLSVFISLIITAVVAITGLVTQAFSKKRTHKTYKEKEIIKHIPTHEIPKEKTQEEIDEEKWEHFLRHQKENDDWIKVPKPR
jgi:uncharacterized membrane protein